MLQKKSPFIYYKVINGILLPVVKLKAGSTVDEMTEIYAGCTLEKKKQ